MAAPIRLRVKDFGQGVAPLRRALSAEAIIRDGIDETAMSFPAVISTIDRDSTGDEMIPAGCDYSLYGNAPSVMWEHGIGPRAMAHPMPLGRAVDPDGVLQIAVEPTRILSRCFVAQKGKWAKDAEDVFHLICEGVLCGISVGFLPIQFERIPGAGHRMHKWHLKEWSVVAAPMNGHCYVIRSMLDRDRIAGKSISPYLRRALGPLAAPVKVWSRGAAGWQPA